MISKQPERASRLEFAWLCAWLILGMVLAFISYRYYGVDFRGYYAAARVLLVGANPYDYEQVSTVLLEVTGSLGNNPFYYPPWFAWMFLPLAMLPFGTARAVWLGINYILWNFSLYRLNSALGGGLNGWRLSVIFTAATFSFAWITWRYEQAGILVLVILVELLISIQKEKPFGAGVWLALLLIKPNVTLLIALGISIWLIRKKQWQPLWITGILLAVLLAVSTAITPDWYKPFFREGFGAGLTTVLDGPDRVVAYRINSTFPDWLGTFGLSKQVRYGLYGISLGIGLIWFVTSVWKSDSLLRAASVSVLASYALTPYALQYDYPPLIIPFFWSLWLADSSPGDKRITYALAAFVLSVIFWQQNISWAYWMVVGLLLLYFQVDRPDQNAKAEYLGS